MNQGYSNNNSEKIYIFISFIIAIASLVSAIIFYDSLNFENGTECLKKCFGYFFLSLLNNLLLIFDLKDSHGDWAYRILYIAGIIWLIFGVLVLGIPILEWQDCFEVSGNLIKPVLNGNLVSWVPYFSVKVKTYCVFSVWIVGAVMDTFHLLEKARRAIIAYKKTKAENNTQK